MEQFKQTSLFDFFNSDNENAIQKRRIANIEESNFQLRRENDELRRIAYGENNDSFIQNSNPLMKVKNEKKKAVKFSLNEKYKAIQEYEKVRKFKTVAKYFKADTSSIKNWVKNKDQIVKEMIEGRKNNYRIKGGGRKIFDEEIDMHLYNYILEQRKNKVPLSQKRLIEYAKSTFKSSDLQFSKGFLQKFLARHNLVYRVTSNKTYIDKNVINEKIVKFYEDLKFYLYKNPEIKYFANVDETRIILDTVPRKTIEFKGQKHVNCITTNSENIAFTVVLACVNNGKKFRPLVIFPGSGKILSKTLKSESVAFCFNNLKNNSFMTSDTWKYWLTEIFEKETSETERREILLFLDNAKVHYSYKVGNSRLYYLPAGTTSQLQPLDISVNSPFKNFIKDCWENYISENFNKITKSGYVQKVPKQVFLNWIKSAWEEISTSTVTSGFRQIIANLGENVLGEDMEIC